MDGMGYIYIYHGFLYAKKNVHIQFMAFCSTRDYSTGKIVEGKGCLYNLGGLGLLFFCFRGTSLLFVSRLTDVFSHSDVFSHVPHLRFNVIPG